MRTATRLVVFTAIVGAVAVFIAPPVGAVSDKDGKDGKAAGTAVAGAPPDAPPTVAPAALVPVTEEDLLGTWTGTILPSGSQDALDGGMITIERGDTGLVVKVGPNARVRFASKRIARTEQGLRFEVKLPDEDETRLLVYDVRVDGARMTGQVTFVRHRMTQPANIEFARQ
jgi:hypothetical protein